METTDSKIRLNVYSDTCYEATDKHGIPCERKSCKQSINHPTGNNCMILTTQSGPLTLREIGKIYDLTRMRICQIEKSIFQKVKKTLS